MTSDIYEIKQTTTGPSGQEVKLVYREELPPENLEGEVPQDVLAYGFHGDKLVVVYSLERKSWVPPGGGIESGEHFKDAIIREVREEASMEVTRLETIGYQDIYEQGHKTRRIVYTFCEVNPLGDFQEDPGGDITEVKLIDPKEWRHVLPNWGEIGERAMARALELKEEK